MNTILITAAGKGLRMQSDIPKQFLELKGKPILMHSIEKFLLFDPDIRIILVLPEEQLSFWNKLCEKHQFNTDYLLVTGGSTRFESVKNGLKHAPDSGLIGVHDGVRPHIHPETIDRIYQAAARHGNAIPAIAPAESVRIDVGGKSHIVDRSTVRLIQTPQVFDAALLKKAYECDFDPRFTDDASVFEAAGHQIHLVEGQVGNVKITTRFDLSPTS